MAATGRTLIAARFGRRAGWGIADQTASSLTNFALGVVIASQTSTAAFGAFSLAFITYLLVLNLGRAVVSLPLMIRYASEPTRWRPGVARGVGVALVVGLAAAVVTMLCGIVIGGETGSALIALAFGLPGLIVQDTWRFGFFAAGRDRDAFVIDFVWAVVLGIGFAAAIAAGVTAPEVYIVVWGVGAAAGALAALGRSGVIPRPAAVPSWWSEHADLIPRFSAEATARMGATQLTYYLVGVIGGLVAVGTLRAGELVLGPFNILFQGVHLVALPEGVRLLKESESALVRWVRVLTAGMAAAALTFGILCLLIPDALGTMMLGESWLPARTVLPALIAALMGIVVSAGAGVGLRALAAADRLLRVAAITSAVTLVAATVGVVAGGPVGAAWGMCAGAWVGAAWSWIELRAAVQNRLAESGVVRTR